MILVLLYRFCESQDSLIGYRLCQQLGEDGYDLLVTTTAKGENLENEQKAAKQMSEKWKGKVTLAEPQHEEFDQPSPEWIAKLHKAYFSYLSRLKDTDTIIGTLPGTTTTGVDLKRALGCKLVLLAATKIGGTQEDIKAEINTLVPEADEIWSVGSDICDHYHNIFHEASSPSIVHDISSSSIVHKQILMKPLSYGENQFYWNWNSQDRIQNSGISKLVTVWNDGYKFYYKGKEEHAKGSSAEMFAVLNAALSEISKDAQLRHIKKLQWNIHGLRNKDDDIRLIRHQCNSYSIQLNALRTVNNLDTLTWKNCQTYIVPDLQEHSFNFIALTAMWLGIPTLISSESSVGKFLLGLDCPFKTRPVVNLSGNTEEDKAIWIEKIFKEILNHDARPIDWAKELSEYLQKTHKLWQLDLTVPSTNIPTNAPTLQGAYDNKNGQTGGTVDENQTSPKVTLSLFEHEKRYIYRQLQLFPTCM